MSDGIVMMFGGKGGVGKTTCAAATALHHARMNKRTLIISTDPTPSLSHIYEAEGRNRVTQVEPNLSFSELGEDVVREMWDKKFGREMHEVFSSFVSVEYEEFSGFVTSVLPGLADEFMLDYTRELVARGEYDVVVWDTAPMGQTMALLKVPAMLANHLRLAPRIYSRLRTGDRSKEPVLLILKRWQRLSDLNMEFLRRQVQVNLVTIAEGLAVDQLDGILRELRQGGIAARQLIVNNLVKDDSSEFLRTRAAGQKHYLDIIHGKYGDLKISELPLSPVEIKGICRLERIAALLFPPAGG